ncbi:carbonyl reductase [NADPH] 3-like [Strongylocentrotus purpuratus]|uniref:carbonyl reductase (NADPH) n=1 Tax=Strongylocentrotus purpuratus TaxID=7668 RepID=A0A7M7P6G1_STRPU|nr:carbonyl reductase [NADPH] 3-like [Strongylocentrotus purpuratus]
MNKGEKIDIPRSQRSGRESSSQQSEGFNGPRPTSDVTGANKGIGFGIVRALCKELGERGVVYLASRDEGRGEKAVQELKGEGLNPRCIQLDICNNDHILKVADYFRDTYGGLDILVNNAGISFTAAATEPDSIQAPVTVETNVFATLRLCRALIPLIRSHGRVVTMAGQLGSLAYQKLGPDLQKRFKTVSTEQGIVDLMTEFISAAKEVKKKELGWGSSNYGVSKLGVIALTRIQGQDIIKDSGREDILINCCCPGNVATDMSSHKGPLTIDQGAVTPVYLALLPGGCSHQGLFFYQKAVKDFWGPVSQNQLLNSDDKFALSQSDAMIPVAYNNLDSKTQPWNGFDPTSLTELSLFLLATVSHMSALRTSEYPKDLLSVR